MLERLKRRLVAKITTAITKRLPIMIGDRLAVRSADGQRLFLDPRDLKTACRMLDSGVWEEHVRAVLAHCLKPGGVYVDVGANVGFHVLHAASLVRDTGRCYAFEPVPRSYDFLVANIDANDLWPWVAAYPFAVSDAGGRTAFHVHATHPMLSAIAVSDDTLRCSGARREDLGRIDVETVSLDGFLGDQRVDVLKIDVEGHEPAVVRGARDLIRRNPRIVLVVERNGNTERLPGGDLEDAAMRSILEAEGFIPYAAVWPQPLRRCAWDALPHADLVMSRTPLSVRMRR